MLEIHPNEQWRRGPHVKVAGLISLQIIKEKFPVHASFQNAKIARCHLFPFRLEGFREPVAKAHLYPGPICIGQHLDLILRDRKCFHAFLPSPFLFCLNILMIFFLFFLGATAKIPTMSQKSIEGS
jgi:hypothetical protein